MQSLKQIMEATEKRVEEEICKAFKAAGIVGPYSFPEGIMGLPSFMNDSDKFIYRLRGGDDWYCDIICRYTNMRIIYPQAYRESKDESID